MAGVPGVASPFLNPQGVAVDGAGNVYVTDNSAIRKVTPAGLVSTLAGSPGNAGNADGPGNVARFQAPTGLTLDADGSVFVADTSNFTIRRITPAGVVSTLAGSAGKDGYYDGNGGEARFYFPTGVAVDTSGNIFVVDSANESIRRIAPDGRVTTLAGGGFTDAGDGTGAAVGFFHPESIAVDRLGSVYVADSGNYTIRKGWPFGTGSDANTEIAVSREGQSTRVEVATINGCTYQLQLSDSLTPPAWTNASAAQIGYGNPLSFTNAADGAPQRFYRVRFTAP